MKEETQPISKHDVQKPKQKWEKPHIKVVPLTELQSQWPKLLSIESSLYASGCHGGRIH